MENVQRGLGKGEDESFGVFIRRVPTKDKVASEWELGGAEDLNDGVHRGRHSLDFIPIRTSAWRFPCVPSSPEQGPITAIRDARHKEGAGVWRVSSVSNGSVEGAINPVRRVLGDQCTGAASTRPSCTTSD